jgi:hypothetical protein
VAVLLVVVAVVAVVVVVVTRIPPEPVPSTCSVSSVGGSGSLSITPEQAQNAAIISAVALRKGVPDHAVTVALAAALQESKLLNLPYGDQDSVGLFQQRPSQGWGTAAQIMDPNYAASAFYDHLVLIDGWQAMPVTEAAQLVQRSAAPNAYAFWEAKARALARALTGETPAGLTCHLAGYGGSVPPSGELAAAASQEMGSNLVGVPVSAKTGWRVATWAVAHAYNYHLDSVTFAGWRWTSGSGSWGQGGVSTSSVVTVVRAT